MTLRIDISAEAEARLRDRAAAGSQPVEQAAARLLEDALRRPSLDEVLAPIRAEFEASGMTDEQLADVLERAKHDLRAQRRSRLAS
jgi:hypothetical protein